MRVIFYDIDIKFIQNCSRKKCRRQCVIVAVMDAVRVELYATSSNTPVYMSVCAQVDINATIS